MEKIKVRKELLNNKQVLSIDFNEYGKYVKNVVVGTGTINYTYGSETRERRKIRPPVKNLLSNFSLCLFDTEFMNKGTLCIQGTFDNIKELKMDLIRLKVIYEELGTNLTSKVVIERIKKLGW
jgi:aryl-phospho-beta-D-glucosidase BglC (GH1 family)